MNCNYFKNIKSYNEFIVKQNNFVNVLSVNIRSVSSINKFNRFKNEISRLGKLPDVIAIQETWFSSQHLDLYTIYGYDAVHCERSDGYGGTTVFVNSKIKYKIILRKSQDDVEAIAIELPDVKVNNSKLVILSVYRSQRCNLSLFLSNIENILQNINNCVTLFVGDVNIDFLVENRSNQLLKNIFSEFNMHYCHKHVTRPQSKTCIDWVYCNNSTNVNVHSIENKLSDHNILSCCVYTQFISNTCNIQLKQKLDYGKFSQILTNTLSSIDNITDSSELCESLINLMSAAGTQSTTTSSKSIDIRLKMTPWMTEKLLALISYKNKLLKLRRKNKNNYYTSHLKRISKIIKICNKKLMDAYYIDNLKTFGGDSKKTWQFLNKELGRHKKSFNEIYDENGTSVMEDSEKVSVFNNYFVDSVNKLKVNIPHNTDDDINMFRTLTPVRSCFNIREVTTTQVKQIIETLNVKKSSGCDNITPKMLLVAESQVSGILGNIFNKMIYSGTYPNCLKIHKVFPIPKTTSSRIVTDFRPISVLPTIDKVFEKLIFNQLSNYIHENKILYECQFGFKKGAGTEEALVNVVEYICGGIDDGCKGVAGLFFDFSKAFDLVQHEILVRKLRVIGFSSAAQALFKDYLHNRMQYVQVGQSKSNMLPVSHGVPQGSVLGPLLFKIYINDLENIKFYGKLILFADDICFLYKYKHEKVLKTQMEYDAAILTEYARINKLVLNCGKTKFIRFKPYHNTNDGEMIVNINGTPIPESESVKYLGIRLSRNLLWDLHIADVKAKISSAIGILYKFKNKFSTDIKMMIYQSLVHSHLTYLPIIYGCRRNNSLSSLQSAQNKALKIVYNLPMRYHSLDIYKYKATHVLPVLGLYEQQILTYMFKTIRGYGSETMLFNRNITRTGRNTRQADNIEVLRCRLELTKQRIGYAGPMEFNKLPSYLKNITIISTFKHELKHYLLQNIETLLI